MFSITPRSRVRHSRAPCSRLSAGHCASEHDLLPPSGDMVAFLISGIPNSANGNTSNF